MPDSSIRWRELAFSEPDVMTDSVAYREKSHLLLPSKGEINSFLAIMSRDSIRFFIGSDGLNSLTRMEAFFHRVYSAVASEPVSDIKESIESMILTNSLRSHFIRDFYAPSFVRGLFDLQAATDLESVIYEVALRTGVFRNGRYRFNFFIRIGTSDPEGLGEVKKLVFREMLNLRKQSRWKLRTDKYATSDDILRNPGNLINFIRIPSERDSF